MWCRSSTAEANPNVSGKDSTSSTTSTGSEGSTSGSDGSEIEGNMDITDDERSPSSHDRASGIISFKVVDHLCYVVIIANILSSSLSFYTPDVLPATKPAASKPWDAGMIIWLERGTDLYMVQLMPLPLTVSCFSRSRLLLPFWYRHTWVMREVRHHTYKGPLNRCCRCCIANVHIWVYLV